MSAQIGNQTSDTTTRPKGRAGGRWASLDNMLLGRTLHLNAVSPLHIPTLPTEATNPASDMQTERDNFQLDKAHLGRLAASLTSYLGKRVLNDQSFGAKKADGYKQASLRHVKAEYVAWPQAIAGAPGRSDTTPSPWAVEVAIQRATRQPQSSAIKAKASIPRAPKVEYAHLVFFSSHGRASQTHYPLLLWKAPPAATFAPPEAPETTHGLETGQDPIRPLTSRILMTHILDFICRYFDCRVSQQEPLRSIRGKDLEKLSDAIVHFHRTKCASFNVDGQFEVDIGYAFPASVERQSDVGQDAARGDASSPVELLQGPAPDLNLISLTIPPDVLRDLTHEAANVKDSLLPAIRRYVALHTSIQLHRLTLVRIGIANVYIGVPTTTSLSRARAGQGSTAEVRLKLNSVTSEGARKEDMGDLQALEVDRIANVIRHLITLVERDQW